MLRQTVPGMSSNNWKCLVTDGGKVHADNLQWHGWLQTFNDHPKLPLSGVRQWDG